MQRGTSLPRRIRHQLQPSRAFGLGSNLPHALGCSHSAASRSDVHTALCTEEKNVPRNHRRRRWGWQVGTVTAAEWQIQPRADSWPGKSHARREGGNDAVKMHAKQLFTLHRRALRTPQHAFIAGPWGSICAPWKLPSRNKQSRALVLLNTGSTSYLNSNKDFQKGIYILGDLCVTENYPRDSNFSHSIAELPAFNKPTS